MHPQIHVSHSKVFWLLLVFAALSLQACGHVKNVVSDGADKHLMLKGHDPVAYFTEGKHMLGDPRIKTDHDGVTYRFASESHRDMFAKEPEKFAPQFGGFCSNGLPYAIKWGGDPDVWKIIDGKLYMFGGEMSRNFFEMDEKLNLERAHAYWNNEAKDVPWRQQTAKRSVFKVPHYKTGPQLAAEWRARQAQNKQ